MSTQTTTVNRIAAGFLGLVAITACGNGNYDVTNSTDRAAMKVEIKQALTKNDCGKAITLSTRLFESIYSDNDTRMLYASAHACNAGIQLYAVLDDLINGSFGTADAVIRTMVRLFPSATSDTRQTSAFYSQDALQTILNPGVVLAAVDKITINANNIGSDLSRDRTLDANSYLMFVAMAEIGTTLNLYGYSAGQSPAALSYGQGQALTWTTKAAVIADTTGSACGLASGFLNMFDGMSAALAYLTGTTGSQVSTILGLLKTGFTAAGAANCTGPDGGYSGTECSAAAVRLRYRGACAEQGPAAAYSAGIVSAINAGWL